MLLGVASPGLHNQYSLYPELYLNSKTNKHACPPRLCKIIAYTDLPALLSLCYTFHSVKMHILHICQLFLPSWMQETSSSSIINIYVHIRLDFIFLNRRLKFAYLGAIPMLV